MLSILSRDTRSEFYPYFVELMQTLLPKVDEWRTKPELLEKYFETISYIFKHLEALMLEDIDKVISYYSSFLKHKKNYIREFSSETLAFLVRNLDYDRLSHVLDVIMGIELDEKDSIDDFIDGVGNLLFFIVKGIKEHFRISSPTAFSLYFNKLYEYRKDMTYLNILRCTFGKMRYHMHHEDNLELWETLLESVELVKTRKEPQDKDQLLLVSCLVGDWVVNRSLKKASYESSRITVNNLMAFLEILTTYVSCSASDLKRLMRQFCKPILNFFHRNHAHDEISDKEDKIRAVILFFLNHLSPDMKSYFGFVSSCVDLVYFGPLVLPALLGYLEKVDKELENLVCYTRKLCNLIRWDSTTSPHLNSMKCVLKPLGDNVYKQCLKLLASKRKSLLKSPDDLEVQSQIFDTLNVLTHIETNGKVMDSVLAGIDQLVKILETILKSSPSDTILFLMGESMRSLVIIIGHSDVELHLDTVSALGKKAMKLLQTHTENPSILKAVGELLDFCSQHEDTNISKYIPKRPELQDIVTCVIKTLNYSSKTQRISALTFIKALNSVLQDELSLSQDLVEKCYSIETQEIDPLQYRLITVAIEGLQHYSISSNDFDRLLALNFLAGTFHIKLSSVWPATRQVLKKFAEDDYKSFWDTIYPIFRKYQDQLDNETLIDAKDHDYSDESEPVQYFLRAQSLLCPGIALGTYIKTMWSCLIDIQKFLPQSSKHLQLLINQFLEFVGQHFLKPKTNREAQSDDKKAIKKIYAERRDNLTKYLEFFSMFKSGKGFYKADQLFQIFTDLLSMDYETVQSLSLKCLFLWKLDYLNAYKDQLEKMASGGTMDAVLKFSLDIESSTIAPQHRMNLAPYIIRILYPRLALHNAASSRRTTVLSYLSSLSTQELEYFFHLMSKTFLDVIETIQSGAPLDTIQLDIEPQKQIGYLSMLKDILSKMKRHLLSQVDTLIKLILVMIINAQKSKLTADKSTRDKLGQIRKHAVKRLGTIMSQFDSHDFSAYANDIIATMKMDTHQIEQQVSQNTNNNLLSWCETISGHKNLYGFITPFIPSIIICLKQEVLSPTIKSTIFSILENLLGIEKDEEQMEIETDIPKGDVLLDYANDLLDSMQSRMMKDYSNKKQFSTRELRIISKCSKYATNAEKADKLISLIFPFLKRRNLPADVREQLLSVFSRTIPLLRDSDRFLDPSIALFESLQTRNERILLCDVVKGFSIYFDTELDSIVDFAYGFNAYSEEFVEEPDYDRRIGTSSIMNEGKFRELSSRSLSLVMYNYLHFMTSTDISLRTSASFGISKIIEYIAETKGNSSLPMSLVTSIVMNSIRRNLNSTHEVVRQEFLSTLSLVVQKFPEAYPDMVYALGTDDDSNVFLNIQHIQTFRRSKALSEIFAFVKNRVFTNNTLLTIFYPLLMRFILEGTQKQNNFIDMVIDVISEMTKELPWKKYYHMLQSVMKSMTKNTALENQFLKLLCNIIDAFHFNISEDSIVEQGKEGKEKPQDVENEEMSIQEDDHEDQPLDEKLREEIQETVVKTIIPGLYTFLKIDDKRQNTIRVSIALAILKLCLHLPSSQNQWRIEKLILEVAETLSSRSQVIRNAGKTTLVQILMSLGPSYFSTILKTLKSVLRRGYQLHILGNVVHTLLKSLIGVVTPGDIDDCISILLSIHFEEIFGQVAEQKDVDKIASSMTEAKQNYAHESIFLIAQLIHFKNSVKTLLDPCIEALLTTTSPKILNNLTEIFNKLQQGFKRNTSATCIEQTDFIKETLEEYLVRVKTITKENVKTQIVKKNQQKFFIEPTPRKVSQLKEALSSQTYNIHIIITFALKMLHSLLKHETLSPKNSDHVSLLDPFIEILFRSVQSRFDSVLVYGMKSLCIIIKFPLPSIEGRVRALTDIVLKLIKRANPKSEIMQMCFKVLTFLVRDCKGFKISDEKLTMILDFTRAALEDVENPALALNLMKSIVWKRLLVPEIYDLIKRLNEMLIQTKNQQVRTLCDSIITQFLITYPLGGKRLEQQLEFILSNISHPEVSGRLSVFSILNSIFSKFPAQVLHEHLDYFYLPLVTQMINDNHSDCKIAAYKALDTFIRNISDEDRNKLFQMVFKWFTNGTSKPSILRVSAQLLDIFYEAMEFDHKTFPTQYIKVVSERYTPDDPQRFEEWEPLYFTLTTLEKILVSTPKFLTHDSMTKILKVIESDLLLHKHAWVRGVSSRILSQYFAYVEENNLMESKKKPVFLNQPQCLFSIAKKICIQLESEFLSFELGNIAEFNLFFSIVYLCKFPDLTPVNEEDSLEDNDDEEERTERLAPYQWVLRRASYMFRRRGPIARMAILKSFTRCVEYFEPEVLTDMAIPILNPVVRMQEWKPPVIPNDKQEIYDLVGGLFSAMRKKLNPSVFVEAYEKIRQTIIKYRLERKSKEAREAVVDPITYAQKKTKKTEKKKRQKKRKIEMYTVNKTRIKMRKTDQ